MRWTEPSTPTSYRSSGPGASLSGLRLVTMTIHRQLDAQHAVLIAGPGGRGIHLDAQLDDAAKRAPLDLHQLVDVALDLGLPALSGEDQLPALDLQVELVGVHPGELRGNHYPRR